MVEYRYRVLLERKDESTEELGVVDLQGEVYGDRTEADAVTAALSELKTSGTFYTFRGVVLPKTDFRTLRAELVQVSDLSAAVQG